MDEKLMDDAIKSNLNNINTNIPIIVKDRINITLSSLPKKKRKDIIFRNCAAGIALIFTIGIGTILYKDSLYTNIAKGYSKTSIIADKKNNQSGTTTDIDNETTQKQIASAANNEGIPLNAKLPVPRPFKYPIEIKSDTYPISSNHSFVIEPKDKTWPGKNLKVYYIPGSGDNQYDLEYKKVLPSDAVLLGTTVINQGKWSYNCRVPAQNAGFRTNIFYIAVLNDEGILSGINVESLNYDKFEIYPKNPRKGEQTIQYRISGLPAGYKAMLSLYKFNPTPWELVTKSDFIEVKDGEISSSFKFSKSTVTAGEYRIEVRMEPIDWNKEDISQVQILHLSFEVK